MLRIIKKILGILCVIGFIVGVICLAIYSNHVADRNHQEGIRTGRIHVHTWGPWSEPRYRWNSNSGTQHRTCGGCGIAEDRYVRSSY